MKLFAAVLLICSTASAADLIIAAASDLAPIAPKIEKAYSQKIKFTLASSGSLKQQIENGAPYDVFLSANEQYVKDLAAEGLVTDEIVYATGRIGLWSPNGSAKSIQDLKKVTHIAIPNPKFAPYGVAAKQALESQGLWKDVEPKIVYGENVRQAMQFAESGNVDAVITSWTLLHEKGSLLPAEWHAPIRQAGAVLKSSHQADAARAFLAFLKSAAAQRIFNESGLVSPKGQ